MASPDEKRRSFKYMRTDHHFNMTNNSMGKTILAIGTILLMSAEGFSGTRAIGLTNETLPNSKLCSREGSGAVIVSNRQY